MSVARPEKAPRKGERDVRLFRYCLPMRHEADSGEISIDDMTEPPFYPWAPIAVDAKTGHILTMDLSDLPDGCVSAFEQTLVNTASGVGMPKKIIVIDRRAEQVLSAFCQRFGVALARRKRCKALTDAPDNMLEHMAAPEEDDMVSSVEDMIDALRQPGLIRGLPDEVLCQIVSAMPDGVLPDDIVAALRKEAKRRGLFGQNLVIYTCASVGALPFPGGRPGPERCRFHRLPPSVSCPGSSAAG